jgi:uncharacterized membrane protein YoaK (UPF0700 family)
MTARSSNSEEKAAERLQSTDLGLALLSFASGSTDVMAFLTLGNIFTSAMTGNMALLAIAVGQGRLLSALLSFLALVGFVLGVAIATIIYDPGKGSARGVLRPLFALEIVCLAGFALAWYGVDRSAENFGLDALILLSATAMGIQGVAARHINAPGINTIVFTSTLVTIVMSVTGALAKPSLHPPIRINTARQIGIFLAYGLGGLVAAFVVWLGVAVIQWIPLLAVIGAVACYELSQQVLTSGTRPTGSPGSAH